jgi:hypothetical protein
MWLAIGGIGIAFIVAMVLLSRMGRTRKNQARLDLEREREARKAPDILELVHQEVVELGLDKLKGSEGVDRSVLLQVYRRDEGNCSDMSARRFVLAAGVNPADATQDTLALRCD